MIISIIIFLGIVLILVFAHECGHFFFAKKFGMKVNEFGFGLPPRIIGFFKNPDTGKIEKFRGDFDSSKIKSTIYSLNALPLGGFVQIKGEDGSFPDDADSFSSKNKIQRAVVLAAGAAVNAVLAIALFSIVLSFGTEMVVSGREFPKSAIIENKTVTVVSALQNSPGFISGIKPGDKILEINNIKIEGVEKMKEILKNSEGKEIEIKIYRDAEIVLFKLFPIVMEQTNQPAIGLELIETAKVKYPWLSSPYYAAIFSYELVKDVPEILKSVVSSIGSGDSTAGVVAGPVGIAVITGEVAKEGILPILQFMALLSINLAIINILPIPALDGGRLLFVLLEAAFGKKIVSKKIENVLHLIGYVFLLVLILYITFGDIRHFFNFSD